jgi:hypothetical protein
MMEQEKQARESLAATIATKQPVSAQPAHAGQASAM